MMNKLLQFLKNDIVLALSCLLALVSVCVVPPNQAYLGYIDFRTLALLFSLMAIMAGLNRLGIFKLLAAWLLGRVQTVRGLLLTFILLCYFSSMIITNDVALLTFVPFTIVTLKLAGESKRLIYTVTLETAAANLGSMLTPIGNPQNLYLFSSYDMSVDDFFLTIDPYATLSLVLLLLAALLAPNTPLTVKQEKLPRPKERWLLFLYGGLFALALCCIFRLLPPYVLLPIVLISLLLVDRATLKGVDYALLLTFSFLFIFIGNLGQLPDIAEFLRRTVTGHEVTMAVLASQVFSNVPAAILLSGFTDNASALLVGVNLGGLGTLIASMASLISLKLIQKEDVNIGSYIAVFTAVNLALLAANLGLHSLIN